MRRAAAAVLLGLLAGCAIAPAPPSPDPILADAVAEGGLGAADPAQAAFCVSQSVPFSLVLLVPDGAAVRPAAPVPADYALTFRRAGAGSGWRRQVAPADPATADRLDQALAGCAALLDARG